MSARLTVDSFRDTASWPQVLNLDATDPRWLQYLNEASQRLLNMAMWVGTTQRYAMCTRNACLTWPRQFESIIAMDLCDRPITLRSQWHEFLENGPGLARLRTCNTFNAFDRGSHFAMFDDILVPSRIRLYPQFPTDVGKTVTIRGLDSNRQPVLFGGGSVDGEIITLQSPYVDSVTIWAPQVFHDVIKQPTNGYVRAYSYDASLPIPPAAPTSTDTPLHALAVWEPTETLPDYRRSFIPSLVNRGIGCCGEGPIVVDQNPTPAPLETACARTRITVIAKMRFIPLLGDTDFLPIGNAPALKLAMLAVMREERGDTVGAQTAMYGVLDPVRRRYVNGAVPLLEDELDAFQGAGQVNVLRLEGGLTDRVNIINLI